MIATGNGGIREADDGGSLRFRTLSRDERQRLLAIAKRSLGKPKTYTGRIGPFETVVQPQGSWGCGPLGCMAEGVPPPEAHSRLSISRPYTS